MKSILTAFAMFSRIPLPRVEWGAGNMRYAMAAFPLIGLVIGLCLVLWNCVSDWLGFGPLCRAAGFTLLPVLVTGGIHLDGFCDTVDALASHADTERKRAILKDPNIGAFAAIGVACYLLAFAAFASEMAPDIRTVAAFGLFFVVSRALSGISVVTFPCASATGFGRSFHDAAERKPVLALLTLMVAAAIFFAVWLGGAPAAVAAVTGFLTLAVFYRMAVRQFGGQTGDLSGWFLQVCELAMLVIYIAACRIGQMFETW